MMRSRSSETRDGVRTISGSIPGASASGSGPGFIWTKLATGQYAVYFTDPFQKFAVSGVPSFIGGVGSIVMNVSRTQGTIYAYTMASAPVDANIYFTVIGKD